MYKPDKDTKHFLIALVVVLIAVPYLTAVEPSTSRWFMINVDREHLVIAFIFSVVALLLYSVIKVVNKRR
jgi:hypothetical protein